MTDGLARPGDVGPDVPGASDREVCRAWFETVAAQCGGLARGVLLRFDGDRPAGVLARWPEGSGETADPQERRLAGEAAAEREGRFEPGTDGGWLLAYPVCLGPRVLAVVLAEPSGGADANPARAMQFIQWGSAWLALRLSGADAAATGTAEAALGALAGLLDARGARPAGVALVQEVARLTGAERVSLGIGGPSDLKLRSVSDVSEFNPRMDEVRRIESAMRESLAAAVPVLLTPDGAAADNAWPAHAALRIGGGGERIETHPLFFAGEAVGAVVIEHRGEGGTGFPAQALAGLLAIAGRALHLQLAAEASGTQRLRRAVRARLQRLFGPKGYRRKTVFAALLLVGLFLAFARGEYRLGAEAQVEAAFQRVVTAPWNGYLAHAAARPGDEVRAGQLLLRLDDRELALERVRWSTEVEKLRKRINQATAVRDRAALMVASAQLRQAEAQLGLVDSQIARIEVVAPFDGLIVSGDPTQRLGDVLKKGEIVHHIAPLHAYRLMIRVPESRVADLHPGLRGTMRLSAVPGLDLALTLERIHPFTQRREGQSFFVAEATLEGDLGRVRPGMEGIATVSIDRRPLLGIWTRGLADRVRVAWWSLFG